MLFCHLYKIFFLLFVFFICNNVYPKCCQSYKKMTANKIRDFIIENYYKQIGFSKGKSYFSMKHLKKELLWLANKFIKKYLILNHF